MALTVLLSAASSGKTTWAISHVREEASGLIGVPRLVVPSQNQVFDCNLRLANLGGAIGVKVTTFEELAWQVLEGSGTYPVMIKENTQSFILKDLLQELELEYYCGIIDMPGFGERVLDIVRELKAGGIKPGQFIDAIHKNDLGIRLLELGKTYQAYERKLEELDLVDSNGVILLAVQELERDPGLCGDWGSLIFDGFDDLSPVQINLIRKISTIIDPVYLTLTGGESSQRSPVIHKRFLRLLGELSRDENLRIRNLDEVGSVLKDEGPLAQVRRRLFSRDKAHVISSFDELKMTAVPDREAEVRTALRWLKNLWKNKQISPGKAAIIMRSQEAYRPILTRVAGEYGMKIRIMGGYPLNENPLAASILALVEVVNSGLTGLTWRDVFDLWGSPYFCWKNIYLDLGIEYSPAKHAFNRIKLKEIAHWGTVVRGFEQWEEVFDLLLTGTADKNNVGSELRLNPVGLTENETRELWDLFTSFCRMISPGVDGNTAEEFISWLEGFLGLSEDSEHSDGVGIVDQILSNEPLIQHRDWKAARQIISIFREFVWANSLLQQGR